jgi:hypothetical protein
MLIVSLSCANIPAETEVQRGKCALIDNTQGQTENPAAQPAAKGHGRQTLKLCAANHAKRHRTVAD